MSVENHKHLFFFISGEKEHSWKDMENAGFNPSRIVSSLQKYKHGPSECKAEANVLEFITRRIEKDSLLEKIVLHVKLDGEEYVVGKYSCERKMPF